MQLQANQVIVTCREETWDETRWRRERGEWGSYMKSQTHLLKIRLRSSAHRIGFFPRRVLVGIVIVIGFILALLHRRVFAAVVFIVMVVIVGWFGTRFATIIASMARVIIGIIGSRSGITGGARRGSRTRLAGLRAWIVAVGIGAAVTVLFGVMMRTMIIALRGEVTVLESK